MKKLGKKMEKKYEKKRNKKNRKKIQNLSCTCSFKSRSATKL